METEIRALSAQLRDAWGAVKCPGSDSVGQGGVGGISISNSKTPGKDSPAV